jgi:2-methylcitrate dehydratase PrpD
MSAPAAPASSAPMESTTAFLAEFATAAPVGEASLHRAASALLDTMAAMLAGGREPALGILAGTLEPAADGMPSFWGAGRYRADDTALLTGMAAHVLDYDDVSMLSVCHPTAPVLSALLPLAWHAGSPGRAVLEALVVGTEVGIRLGQAMGFRHYALGFHATGTLGAVGAAAACARLLRLDRRQTAHALAIACSLSAGLRANFGSMVKSMHVGLAAANGLKAARWAAAGITAAPEAIEGQGFLHAFSGGETTAWPAGLALGRPYAITEPGFEQKRYPCCYMLHKMIEAALGLRAEAGIGLADVAAMRVDVAQGGTSALIHPYPRNGLNALFSAPYAILASLEDGRIDLASFTDAAVLRPHIQARLREVQVIEAATPSRRGDDVGSAPVTVTLTLTNGARLSRIVTASPGSPSDPLTPDQLGRKWRDCVERARPGLGPDQADALLQAGWAVPQAASIRPWLDALQRAVAS